MASLNVNKAEFVRSAASPEQFIRSSVPAVVFAGKSNVGKSSVINRILNRKNIARVGNTPGKTVHINYFLIDGKLYFLDLPGYGFASVSRSEKERWSVLMEQFFAEKDLYSLGILIVDARHAPTKDDVGMASFFRQSGVPFLVLANKTDKLKNSELNANLALIRQTLDLGDDISLIPFSAQSGQGRDLLLSAVTNLI
ncbi:MAG: YihA family ribosome biogenesis GTP-binding protein [Oscillospiraceae bacterium]|nr:YihA family ribosome biogenesis GTP-binding protein [Oscillospiraceae bacterium]